MKQNLVILALSAIALLGLPSCTTSSSAPTTTTPTTVATLTQTSIKIGASSSTLGLTKVLQTNYEATAKNAKITQLEPGQSENIIDGIKQRVVDLGAISKTLKPEENDGSLESREVAHDALLVATHPSVTGVKNLTTEQIKDIYNGTITNWKQVGGNDAKIVLLDRPEDESAKRLLRKHYLGKDLKNSPEAVVLRKEGELIQAIQSTPYSIGTFSLAHAISHKLSVNRLNLNGVEPTRVNVKTGNYPMVRAISIVWHKNPTEPTQALIQYISSQPGINAMEQSGFISVTPSAKN
ncbi:MAG: phosphate ABC transporter substrate-binding protein [Oscillatoriales cyanobacterium]|nr:MAG: phosphate ABC transporter substrate-binding protein [Oscillatoriales cyanobacterium]TAH25971.1 MAG: phosphate ABC transporter substrate-binding protein [Oscillatoriales cyanobacterium]